MWLPSWRRGGSQLGESQLQVPGARGTGADVPGMSGQRVQPGAGAAVSLQGVWLGPEAALASACLIHRQPGGGGAAAAPDRGGPHAFSSSGFEGPRMSSMFGKPRAGGERPPQSPLTECNVAILGCRGAGKSALTVKFLTKRFISEYDPNLEDTYTSEELVDQQPVLMKVMDTADQDGPGNCERYLRWASAFLVVYSIDDRKSFEGCQQYLEVLALHARGCQRRCPVLLLGNKLDMEQYRCLLLKGCHWRAGSAASSTRCRRARTSRGCSRSSTKPCGRCGAGRCGARRSGASLSARSSSPRSSPALRWPPRWPCQPARAWLAAPSTPSPLSTTRRSPRWPRPSWSLSSLHGLRARGKLPHSPC
ncbi:ras-like protein family member 12 isoform X2 [Melanerpes formicivorus]|uniref:ras-like protein family member 12 isoform X2 n=1 Tax=Melanerpes formicivorus TaxID=211600 RepID=UPI00358E8226